MKANIKYGFYSNYYKKIFRRKEMKNDELYEEIIFKSYYLQTPQELLKNGAGICFDQVEFEKYWFESHGYKTYSFFCDFHNHAFLIYEDNKKFYLFERTFKELNGIHEENSLEEVLEYYVKVQLKNDQSKKIKIYEYKNVIFGSTFYEHVFYVTKGEKYADKVKKV